MPVLVHLSKNLIAGLLIVMEYFNFFYIPALLLKSASSSTADTVNHLHTHTHTHAHTLHVVSKCVSVCASVYTSVTVV